MAASGSNDRFRDGRREVQRDADARIASDADQTAAELDQTLADSDQSASDADQDASDADQGAADRDRDAAERDQATADRDEAQPGHDADDGRAYARSRQEREAAARDRNSTAAGRAKTAAARLDYANRRDEIARLRDLSAADRDRNAVVRDEAARARELHAADRAAAARDREHAAADRHNAGLDELTGVFRRGNGELALSHEMARARRAGVPLVVAMIDVDALKAVNDAHGHLVGDALLRDVPRAITATLRAYDVTVRWGGDEFVCALSDVGLDTAALRIIEIQTALEALHPGASISAGLALLDEEDTLEALVDRADAALYRVKDARGG